MRTLIRMVQVVSLILLPACLRAAEGSSSLVIVADSRHLTGLSAWWANLYNENHLYFAVLTVIAVPVAGSILGGAADYLIGRIGIDLKSRTLAEN